MLSRIAGYSALLLAASGMAWDSRPAPRLSEDEAAVRETLQHYLNGHATGKADEFRVAMNPDGTMYFVRDGQFARMSLADYIARAAGSGQPAPDEARRKRRIEFVDITGNAAVGKVVLEYPDVTLTDYMELLKIDGKWQIVAKSFHADRKGS